MTSSRTSRSRPGLLARHHDLGRGRQRHRVEEVVEQLGGVAGPGAAAVEDVAADQFEDRPRGLQGGRRAADHQRERALLGRRGAAGDPGVQVVDVELGQPGADPPGRLRRRGAEVDDHLARAQLLDQPAAAQHHLLDDRAVGQREQHQVGRGGDGRRRRGRLGAAAADAVGRQVVAENRLARVHQDAGDAAAHVPQPDESDCSRCHGVLVPCRTVVPGPCHAAYC